MSFQAMTWAIKEPLPPYEKLALLLLANYASPDGVCWPSLTRLCLETGMSRTQICRVMTKLEEKNLIHRRQRDDGKRGRLTTVYTLALAPVETGIKKLVLNMGKADLDDELMH